MTICMSLFLIIFNVFSMDPSLSYEQKMVSNLKAYIDLEDSIFYDLYSMASRDECSELITSDNALFRAYPILKNHINYISLGSLPTPIVKADHLSNKLEVKDLYIKQDGLTGKALSDSNLFGGNKVRKLEFLLADALAHHAKTVLTFGCAGSNHALATATYAQFFGLKSILMLKNQHNSHVVRRNLLLDLQAKATLTLSPNNRIRAIQTVTECVRHVQDYQSFPYIIPTGGSCPLGILGYVNAVFELKEQIEAGIMPEPDRIYVPVGSAGTIVGILIGIKAAGLKSSVIGIAVEPEELPNEFIDTISNLYAQTSSLLQQCGCNLTNLFFESQDLKMMYNFTGNDYALFTQEAKNAMELLALTEGITLDGVYTGKAFAGVLDDIKNRKPDNEIVLFWNTFCADNFEEIEKLDYKDLPKCFHKFFEEDVQELDRI